MEYSLLVPVYNVKEYLSRCIDSILVQDYPSNNYEIILVDDGSTDGSGDICDDYSNKYNNISVIHQENKGLLQARGAGVGASSGEYLLFIDSDDYVEPNLLSAVDRYIEEFSPDILSFGYYIEYSNKSVTNPVTKNEYELFSPADIITCFAQTDEYNTIWNKVVKGNLLREHRGEVYSFVTNIGEDKVQTAFLLKYANNFLFIRDCLYHYNVRDTSIVHNKTEADIHSVIMVYDRIDDAIRFDIGRLSISDEERKALYCGYRTNALNSAMDHIFKLNRRTDIRSGEKCNCLDRILQRNIGFFSDGMIYHKSLMSYNKVRYGLLINRHYRLLVIVDVCLGCLKSIFPNI